MALHEINEGCTSPSKRVNWGDDLEAVYGKDVRARKD